MVCIAGEIRNIYPWSEQNNAERDYWDALSTLEVHNLVTTLGENAAVAAGGGEEHSRSRARRL